MLLVVMLCYYESWLGFFVWFWGTREGITRMGTRGREFCKVENSINLTCKLWIPLICGIVVNHIARLLLYSKRRKTHTNNTHILKFHFFTFHTRFVQISILLYWSLCSTLQFNLQKTYIGTRRLTM
jgi:hypothetical protein